MHTIHLALVCIGMGGPVHNRTMYLSIGFVLTCQVTPTCGKVMKLPDMSSGFL